METRSKTLVVLFGLAVVSVAFAKLVYPRWVEPLVHLDDQLERTHRELDKLRDEQDRVAEAAERYKALLAQAGGFEMNRMAIKAENQITSLIEKNKLRARSVSPLRPVQDRKNKIWKKKIGIQAEGTLQSVVVLLRDLAELPYVCRLGKVTLRPVGRSRKKRAPDLINLDTSVELWALPPQMIVGYVDPEQLKQPEKVTRHAARDYAPIWTGGTFTEFVPLAPLVVRAGKDQPVRTTGKPIKMRPNVTGGDGEYTFRWTPAKFIDQPDQLRPSVITKEMEPGTHEITLTVTDGQGTTASDTLVLSVMPPAVKSARKPNRPARPPPEPDPRWKNRRDLQITGAYGSGDGTVSQMELQVWDVRQKKRMYYAVGDEFDGGELLFVHQLGGVVRRKSQGQQKYYIYPTGRKLDQGLPAERAGDFPRLQRVAQRMREADDLQPPQPADPDVRGEKPQAGANTEGKPTPAGDVDPTVDRESASPAKQESKPGVRKSGREFGPSQLNRLRQTRSRNKPPRRGQRTKHKGAE